MNKKLYVLIVVAMLAAMVLPMTAFAQTDALYLSGKVYDKVNNIGIGGVTVELWYERTTIVGEDRWDPDRYEYEWILVDTSVSTVGAERTRGTWMVETRQGHTGKYKLVFTAPEDTLLPDGQAVTYTADNSYTWNSVGVPNYRIEKPLAENPDLGPNQCEAVFVNLDKTNNPGWPEFWDLDDLGFIPLLVWVPDGSPFGGHWVLSDGTVMWQEPSLIVNFVADTTTVVDDCGYADMMYVYGMVYDPRNAGDPAWPDKKEDGIGGVEVQLWRQWRGSGPASPWVGPVWGQAEMIRRNWTSGDGYYIFSVQPTDTPSVEDYWYFLVIKGVATRGWTAYTCPPVDSIRVQANFNDMTGLYDSLHTLP